MREEDKFLADLETKVAQQLGSDRVGYLLGAGASYLDGKGFPLAGGLWERVCGHVPDSERSDVQRKLDEGADGIEQALDLLDDGAVAEKPHRHLVTEAIAQHFLGIRGIPLNHHRGFLRRLARRRDMRVPVFCLNYDALLEMSADEERIRLHTGFSGITRRFFDPQVFQERAGTPHAGMKSNPHITWTTGIIHLYKLHGSLGWFSSGTGPVGLDLEALTPTGAKRMMIPPQHRKANETTAPPFAALWSNFRGLLVQGPETINRLVAIGYGMRDEHVNVILDNALKRSHFTLIVCAFRLTDDVYRRWSPSPHVIIVTSNRCSLYGRCGPGHEHLWKFENLSERV